MIEIMYAEPKFKVCHKCTNEFITLKQLEIILIAMCVIHTAMNTVFVVYLSILVTYTI
jgi:hypothetical protein